MINSTNIILSHVDHATLRHSLAKIDTMTPLAPFGASLWAPAVAAALTAWRWGDVPEAAQQDLEKDVEADVTKSEPGTLFLRMWFLEYVCLGFRVLFSLVFLCCLFWCTLCVAMCVFHRSEGCRRMWWYESEDVHSLSEGLRVASWNCLHGPNGATAAQDWRRPVGRGQGMVLANPVPQNTN